MQIGIRNKVKKRFSALNDHSRPKSPRSHSPPLDKMFKETLSIKKVGDDLNHNNNDDDDDDVIKAPSQNSFHGTFAGPRESFQVLNKRTSFTTDDVVLEMARTSSNDHKKKDRKMSD